MAKPERARPVVTDLVTGQVTAEDLDLPAPPVVVAVEVLAHDRRVEAARALRPPEGEACRACWLAGRDAVIGMRDAAHWRHHLRAYQRGADAARAVFTP